MTRSQTEYYLNAKLGDPKSSKQGLRYNCPKPGCDQGNKYNLEIKLYDKALVFNCWSCRYSGFLRKLLEDYAVDRTWENISELKRKRSEFEEEEDIVDIGYPEKTISYHLSDRAVKLLMSRGMDHKELRRRGVQYVADTNSEHHDCICFPFRENGIIVGACLYHIGKKKYKNLGKLTYVPYGGFINKNYPIFVTEGVFDALSAVNAIPLLRTDINKKTLEFLYDCDVILGVDNSIDLTQYLSLMDKLGKSKTKSLTLFDLHTYKDPNEFLLDDPETFMMALADAFSISKDN